MADINQAKKYVNMTDLNAPVARGGKADDAKMTGTPAGKGAALPEDKLQEFAELLFFAYRDFTGDPDAILKDFGFGRAITGCSISSTGTPACGSPTCWKSSISPSRASAACSSNSSTRAISSSRQAPRTAASGCCSPPNAAGRWPNGWPRPSSYAWPMLSKRQARAPRPRCGAFSKP